MIKSYAYEPKGYRFRVVWIGCILIALAPALAVLYALDPTRYIYLFGVCAAVYGALNTFVFKSNPKRVVIDDETISFVSFGEARYTIRKLKTFSVREFANAQFYIRVEEVGGRRGRYWVHYYYFENREELIDELYCIEKRVHPGNLKFRGRERMFHTRPCYIQREPVEQELEIDPFFKE